MEAEVPKKELGLVLWRAKDRMNKIALAMPKIKVTNDYLHSQMLINVSVFIL